MFRRYVAKYVRRPEVFERLASIPPNEKPGDDKFRQGGYTPKALMVEQAMSIVCLIDITAYSNLTAILAQRLGRFGSELISDTVGKYLSQIIDLIERDKGDVVKFLGDAMLVRFDVAEICKGSWTPNQSHIPAMAIKVDCCLDILSIYHEYSVDFQQLHRPTSTKTSGSNHTSNHLTGNNSSVHIVSYQNELEDLEGYKLSLHIGITAGVVDNIIIGLPGERMDYTIAGPALTEIGDLLKAAKGGELSLPTRLWKAFESDYPIFIRGRIKHDTTAGISVITKCEGQTSFNPGITMPTTRSGRRSSLVPLPSSVVRNASQSDIPNMASFSAEAQVVFRQFVNASLVHKIEYQSGSRENVAGESEEFSEYRRMTILFLKLKFPFEPNLSQLCMEICLDSLSKFDGVLQQFSVDDKGTTILAAFGLPPLTHENECDFALKCALDMEQKLKATELAPFSISLATGETLFSVLGNQTRSEAGLLSDVVVVAARLMVCDDTTRLGMEKEDCAESFACVGQFQLKGRTDYVPVWKVMKPISRKRVMKADRRWADDMVGYAAEVRLTKGASEKSVRDLEEFPD
ncbi:Adenylate cyclase type 10 [Dinochytrium kinnereticum]|nr:Adenylate cyclase type 10 [Dinochytrium kinnereticum]